MGHGHQPHTWGEIYELSGASYRERSDPDCSSHQEWICALDRWSDTFDTPSPRGQTAQPALPPAEPAKRETAS